jgi:hypothetical protein
MKNARRYIEYTALATRPFLSFVLKRFVTIYALLLTTKASRLKIGDLQHIFLGYSSSVTNGFAISSMPS